MIVTDQIIKCESAAHSMRNNILQLAHQAGNYGSHVGPALSIVEIMSVLYLAVMKYNAADPRYEDRDRFILSKGHGALGYYVALHEAGIITRDELYSYEVNGGFFPGQPSKHLELGIEFSGGSLGLGLSYATGIALAAKQKEKQFNTYVLMGDGEINEGTVWESAMFAKHHRLSNLTAIIDRNHMQSDGKSEDILSIDMEALWKGFGWEVIPCNGHDVKALMEAFDHKTPGCPKVIIANTVKGKGISFMENSKEWHHNRLTDELFEKSISELTKEGCS